ncbi:hypothetical protein BLOT_015616 [Blomia tropicalis]|nr:hypothetical protein BLOT_015616 [Blomia tropicalis]
MCSHQLKNEDFMELSFADNFFLYMCALKLIGCKQTNLKKPERQLYYSNDDNNQQCNLRMRMILKGHQNDQNDPNGKSLGNKWNRNKQQP